MQRNLAKCLIRKYVKFNNQTFHVSARSFATVKDIFQNKSEFPTRHIGVFTY